MAGEHKVKPLPYEYNKLKGISEQVNKWHHDTHYAGYVNKRNEVEKELEKVDRSAANANWSMFRALKDRETFNANGQVLHEIYYDIMGGDGNVDESLPVVKKIISDFGSVEKWKEDFIASAKVGLGWAVLCWDPTDGKLRNITGDSHNQGAIWGSVPLVPCDVFEHAYYYDQGPNRAKYIEAFLGNLNWKEIDRRFKKYVPRD